MKSSRTSAAQAVVDALEAEQVKYLFGLLGSHVLPIFERLADSARVQHVVTKHESNAAFMAGMVGYLTGRPGVVLTTAGPGATNALTGVAQAYSSSLPMVHISGDVPLGAGNEVFHGTDREDFLHKMFTDVTKWSVRVERPEEIPRVLSRAFALAASGRPGPVHVEIPLNLLQAQDVDIPAYQPSPAERQEPPEDALVHARRALALARRPFLCVGRGVLLHRAEAELVVLAETISAPVLYTEFARGVIAADHHLAVGSFSEWRGNPFAWELMAESDLLLAVGLRSGTQMTEMLAQHAPARSMLVALDEPHTLRPVEGMAPVVAGDSRLFLSRLLAHADEFRRPADRSLMARIVRRRRAFQRGLTMHLAPFGERRPMHFGRVMQELAERLDRDAIVVSGVGNHNVWPQMTLAIRDRESFIQENAWCTMGSELGGGIAAKLVYPERQVVVITGDGSLLMVMSDLVTAVEQGANILIVVLNDSRYGMITTLQQKVYGRAYGDEIGQVDFARLGESLGAVGVRVESPEALPEVLTRSLAMSDRRPVILDAVCDYRHYWPDLEAILAQGLEQEPPNGKDSSTVTRRDPAS